MKRLLRDEAETTAAGQRLAPLLRPGDTVALFGPIGAGKSTMARAIIAARLGAPEDIPSPTFTLVQIYETPEAEIWHADLYRLSSLDEVVELGLEDAFETAVCLVEWPERLGPLLPTSALRITLTPTADDRRMMTLEWSDPRWNTVAESMGNEQ